MNLQQFTKLILCIIFFGIFLINVRTSDKSFRFYTGLIMFSLIIIHIILSVNIQ